MMQHKLHYLPSSPLIKKIIALQCSTPKLRVLSNLSGFVRWKVRSYTQTEISELDTCLIAPTVSDISVYSELSAQQRWGVQYHLKYSILMSLRIINTQYSSKHLDCSLRSELFCKCELCVWLIKHPGSTFTFASKFIINQLYIVYYDVCIYWSSVMLNSVKLIMIINYEPFTVC